LARENKRESPLLRYHQLSSHTRSSSRTPGEKSVKKAFKKVHNDREYQKYLVRFIFFTLRTFPESVKSKALISSLRDDEDAIFALQDMLEEHFLVHERFFAKAGDCHVLRFYELSSFEPNGTLRKIHLLTKTASFILYWIRICVGYTLDRV
jgi:hypothetical protein